MRHVGAVGDHRSAPTCRCRNAAPPAVPACPFWSNGIETRSERIPSGPSSARWAPERRGRTRMSGIAPTATRPTPRRRRLRRRHPELRHPPRATPSSPARSAAAAIFLLALMAAIATFLVWRATNALSVNTANVLTYTGQWAPDDAPPKFGIGAAAWGTLVTSTIAIVIAAPGGHRRGAVHHPVRPAAAGAGARLHRRPAGRGALDRLRPVGHPVPGAAHAGRLASSSRTSWAGSRCSPRASSAARCSPPA